MLTSIPKVMCSWTFKEVHWRKVYKIEKDFYPGIIFGLPSISSSSISLKIPKGFETDGASIPWIARWFFVPRGKWFEAAAVHDFLYTKNANCSKWLADIIFLVMMRLYGVNFITACLFWTCVTFCGWFSYGRRKDWKEGIGN